MTAPDSAGSGSTAERAGCLKQVSNRRFRENFSEPLSGKDEVPVAVKRGKNKKIQIFFKRRLEKKQKKYYIMEHEEIRAADTDYWKPSWRNGRRAWFRSKFFHRSGGSTPPDGTKYSVKNCGYGITAVHQPSKLVIGVRPPLPAPNFFRWDCRAVKGGRL